MFFKFCDQGYFLIRCLSGSHSKRFHSVGLPGSGLRGIGAALSIPVNSQGLGGLSPGRQLRDGHCADMDAGSLGTRTQEGLGGGMHGSLLPWSCFCWPREPLGPLNILIASYLGALPGGIDRSRKPPGAGGAVLCAFPTSSQGDPEKDTVLHRRARRGTF